MCDENIPKWFVEKLRQKWYDVLWVTEYKSWETDSNLIQLFSQRWWFLLTYDSDFGELVFSLKYDLNNWNIIYSRELLELVWEKIFNIVDKYKDSNWYFIILGKDKIRVRRIV